MISKDTLTNISKIVESVDALEISTVEKIMVLESALGIMRAKLSAEQMAHIMSTAMRRT